MIPAGDTEGILNHFMAIGGFLENRGTKVDTHSHMIHMGYIAILLAAVGPMWWPERRSTNAATQDQSPSTSA